jgi:GNAT superfamily N-acetyltransferase
MKEKMNHIEKKTHTFGNKAVKTCSYILEVRKRDKPDDPPFVWLLVDCEEFFLYDVNNEVQEAWISFDYKTFSYYDYSFSGQFEGGFSRIHHSNGPRVSLSSKTTTTKGDIIIRRENLQGHRIGTYFFNEIVKWAKQWHGANTNSMLLVKGDALTDEERTRRNRFYERFGIIIDFEDSEKRAGVSRVMPVDALTPVDTWTQNIKEISLTDFIYAFSHLQFELSEAKRAETNLLEVIREYRNFPFCSGLRLIGRSMIDAICSKWGARLFWLAVGALVLWINAF